MPAVEQSGAHRRRAYRKVYRDMGPGDVVAHLRGYRRYGVGAPERVRHLVLDCDHAGWGPSHEARVAACVGYCREALHVEPVVLTSPGGGHHVYAFWPTRVDREWARALVRRGLNAYSAERGVDTARHVEVRPTGQCLRLPCGPRQLLVDPDTLEPVDGTCRLTAGRRARVVHSLVREFLDRVPGATVSVGSLLALEAGQGASGARPEPGPAPSPSRPSQPSRPTSYGVIRGDEWRAEIRRLRERGIPAHGERNRAVGRMVWQLYVAEGRERHETLDSLGAWLIDHELDHHTASPDPVGESLAEADRWLTRYERAVGRGEVVRQGIARHGALLSTRDRSGSLVTDNRDRFPAPLPCDGRRERLAGWASGCARSYSVTVHHEAWVGETWADEADVLLGYLASVGEERKADLVLSFDDLIGVCGRRRVDAGGRHVHAAVEARRALERAGVLKRTRGWCPSRGHAAVYRVDVAQARSMWTGEDQVQSQPRVCVSGARWRPPAHLRLPGCSRVMACASCEVSGLCLGRARPPP